MADRALKKRIWGWYAFDWANQPFYTLGLTFIFGPFFASVSLTYFLEIHDTEDTAKAASQALWFWGQTVAGLFIAFTAPIVGAYADSSGRRMPWIWFFSLLYLPVTYALWWTDPAGSNIYLMLLLFNLGLIASEFILLFVNALLPSLGGKNEIGRISGNGAAIGYWGGVLSLFIMLLLFAENDTGKTLLGNAPALGLDPDTREGTRAVGPFIAIWFAIFMVPFFLWVREPRSPAKPGGMGKALGDLKQSLIAAYQRKSLFSFLISSMLYRDALNALYAAGGFFATLVLGWSITQIGVFGIVGAITAAIATQVGGIFDSRLGPRPVITFCCFVLITVCLIIIGMDRDGLFGLIAFGPESAAPDIIFYICGASIGGAGGAIYAASRSMMCRHTHPDRPTEAFGLFALSGKATAFLAPLLISVFSVLTGNPQLGYIPVIILLLLGLLILARVNPEGDQSEWSASSATAH